MALWILEPIYRDVNGKNHWDPWYDKMFGIVVMAQTEDDARAIAMEEHGDEWAEAWLHDDCSSCCQLEDDGSSRMILKSISNA